LRVQSLPRRVFARCQGRGTLQIEFRIRKQRFVACLRGPRLGKLGLKRPRINLRQYVALGYLLTFNEGDPIQMPVNPCLDRDDIEGVHGADTAQEDRHVLALYQRGPHRNGWCWSLSLRRRLLLPRKVPSRAGRDGDHQHRY